MSDPEHQNDDFSWKRTLSALANGYDTDEQMQAPKRTRAVEIPVGEDASFNETIDSSDCYDENKKCAAIEVSKGKDSSPSHSTTLGTREMQSAPYFFYRDFSEEVDEDPLTPLTPPGSQPGFPAKMHDILSHPEFSHIITWLKHGRAWRILNPREFESRVIPAYFEHSKFSSFVRQTNGWGFRRIKNGCDHNAYYHERFLRGLPHLSKKMKRLGVAEKNRTDPDHEPDLHKISEEYRVPEKASPDDGVVLDSTLRRILKTDQDLNANVNKNATWMSSANLSDFEPTPLAASIHGIKQDSSHGSSTYVSFNQPTSQTTASNIMQHITSQQESLKSYEMQTQAQNEDVPTATLTTDTPRAIPKFHSTQVPFQQLFQNSSSISNTTFGPSEKCSESTSHSANAFATGDAVNLDYLHANNGQTLGSSTNEICTSSITANPLTVSRHYELQSSKKQKQNYAQFKGNNLKI